VPVQLCLIYRRSNDQDVDQFIAACFDKDHVPEVIAIVAASARSSLNSQDCDPSWIG
jgi:hypothetical protein